MRSRRLIPIVLATAAAVMAALVYLNALSNPFVYDDHLTVIENASIRNLADLRSIFLHDVFRPVVNLTYAVDYALWGLVPFGFHLTGLLLHAANVLLTFVLTRKLVIESRPTRVGREPLEAESDSGQVASDKGALSWRRTGSHENSAAFAAAAIYAVHPMMTQAVGYVSGRAEVLCAFFFLAALLSVLEWLETGHKRWLALSIGCWGVSLASKEVGVMLPFVLIAYDALILSRVAAGARRRLARVYGPVLLLVAVAGALRLGTFLLVENASRARFVWGNALVDLDVVRRYVSLMFLPNGQSIFHTARVVTTLANSRALFNVTWLLAVAVITWKLRRREPVVTFGIIWFLLMLVPSAILLVFDIGEAMAEQRVYLAGCGFAMAMGAGFGRLREWPSRHWVPAKVLATVVLGWLLVSLAARTIVRNRIWNDPVLLWSEAVYYSPDIWVPYRGLGDALRERGDYPGAIEAYRGAVQLKPDDAATYLPLGTCLAVTNELREADEAFAKAASLSPGLVEAETGRGVVARLAGRRDEARDRFLNVIKIHPDAILPRQYLAEMYEVEYADPASALRVCREIAALAPQTEGVADCIRRNEIGSAKGAQRPNGR
jgi:hypothetical protein